MKRWSINQVATAVILPLILLGLWQFGVERKWLPEGQTASPLAVANTAWRGIFSGELAHQAGISIRRCVLGLFIGAGLGMCTAMSVMVFRALDWLATPFLVFLAGIPVIAWMPLSIAIFGIGESFKIALIALTTFLIVFVASINSARTISRTYIEVAHIYRLTPFQKIRWLYFRGSIPEIMSGLCFAQAIAWVILILAEYATASAGSEGLGFFISNARELGKVEEQYAGFAMLGLIAYCGDLLLRLLGAWAGRWRP
jgi:sulfonate transport system permease protein